MKTSTASGIAARTWRAPWTSISSTTERTFREPPLDLGAKRPVAIAAVGGVLEEVVRVRPAVELGAVEEVVVARRLSSPSRGLARRRRDRELELGDALAQLADQRPLADPGRASDDEDLRHAGSLEAAAVA